MKSCAKIVALLLLLICSTLAQAAVPYPDGTITCSAAAETEFVPSWGEVFVSSDSASKYIYQWMYWDNYGRLAWFTANGDSTFEPDAFFDGYGSGNPEPVHPTDVLPTVPGNSSTAYGYYPRNVSYNSGDIAIGYWASDLPSPYQDTAWGDGGSEWAVTIGTAMAATLSPQRVYYTVTRMLDGGASSGEVKLSSQRGRLANPTTPWFVPYWGKWNSYGCAGTNNVKTIPWYTFTAPGCYQYWYTSFGANHGGC